MTLRVFCCTCFVQGLSLGLDKLFSRSIKCVFVGLLKRYIDVIILPLENILCLQMSLSLSLFYISPNILLLPLKLSLPLSVSLPAPVSTNSSLVPLVDTLEPPASIPVRDFRYVYTHRQKVLASEPAPAYPIPVDGPSHQP